MLLLDLDRIFEAAMGRNSIYSYIRACKWVVINCNALKEPHQGCANSTFPYEACSAIAEGILRGAIMTVESIQQLLLELPASRKSERYWSSFQE